MRSLFGFVMVAVLMAGNAQGQQTLVAPQDGEGWWRLARLYQDKARYDEAERAYNKAVVLLKDGDRLTYANAIDGMGTMYVETGRYALATPLEQQALAIREAEKDQSGVGRSWMHLSMLALGQHETAEAVRYGELAVERFDATSAASPEERMTALIYLSLARCAQGQCAAALPSFTQAHLLAMQSQAPGSFAIAYTDFLLGWAHWKIGDAEPAAALMKSGTEGMEAQLGFGHPTYVASMQAYAEFLRQAGKTKEAAEMMSKISRVEMAAR